MHVAAQEILHGWIEKELQIQSSGIRQRHHEAGPSSLGASYHYVPKVSPVDLRLLAGKGLQLQERLAALWAQAGHGTPQLHHAAAVAAVANHLVDARGAQAGMWIEGVANELHVGIDDGYPQRLGVPEAFALQCIANGVWVDAQFTGNGADFPVFGVKVAANLRTDFRTDHAMAHFRCGIRGKGSMKRPVRPQIWQRGHNQGWICCPNCGAGGGFTASAHPQSNDAGERIETEP